MLHILYLTVSHDSTSGNCEGKTRRKSEVECSLCICIKTFDLVFDGYDSTETKTKSILFDLASAWNGKKASDNRLV